jgi:hypothetical protein
VRSKKLRCAATSVSNFFATGKRGFVYIFIDAVVALAHYCSDLKRRTMKRCGAGGLHTCQRQQ